MSFDAYDDRGVLEPRVSCEIDVRNLQLAQARGHTRRNVIGNEQKVFAAALQSVRQGAERAKLQPAFALSFVADALLTDLQSEDAVRLAVPPVSI
jgi:hypothetical protein